MAMLPLGKILSCIILAANPTVICEIVFEKKEAADQCISQYNNQLADGTSPPHLCFDVVSNHWHLLLEY